jgi:hypothetical protein
MVLTNEPDRRFLGFEDDRALPSLIFAMSEEPADLNCCDERIISEALSQYTLGESFCHTTLTLALQRLFARPFHS